MVLNSLRSRRQTPKSVANATKILDKRRHNAICLATPNHVANHVAHVAHVAKHVAVTSPSRRRRKNRRISNRKVDFD